MATGVKLVVLLSFVCTRSFMYFVAHAYTLVHKAQIHACIPNSARCTYQPWGRLIAAYTATSALLLLKSDSYVVPETGYCRDTHQLLPPVCCMYARISCAGLLTSWWEHEKTHYQESTFTYAVKHMQVFIITYSTSVSHRPQLHVRVHWCSAL